MPEPEVLAMLSHSQEFEQVKVSTLTGIRPQYAINRVVVPMHREFSVLFFKRANQRQRGSIPLRVQLTFWKEVISYE